MEEDKDRAFPVRQESGTYLVKGRPEKHMMAKFLARNRADGELFLLMSGHGKYSLLKGSLGEGLRPCEIRSVESGDADFSISFVQDSVPGILTDPDLPGRKPVYESVGFGYVSSELEIVPFRMAD